MLEYGISHLNEYKYKRRNLDVQINHLRLIVDSSWLLLWLWKWVWWDPLNFYLLTLKLSDLALPGYQITTCTTLEAISEKLFQTSWLWNMFFSLDFKHLKFPHSAINRDLDNLRPYLVSHYIDPMLFFERLLFKCDPISS